jgi:hypothetical protein
MRPQSLKLETDNEKLSKTFKNAVLAVSAVSRANQGRASRPQLADPPHRNRTALVRSRST